MATLFRAFLGAMISCAAFGALAQTFADDAAVLRRSLSTLELAARPEVRAAFRPYVDCYSDAIEGSPWSALRRDDEVRSAERHARERCGAIGAAAMASADLILGNLSARISPGERVRILRDVRRQLVIFGLIRRYAEAGRGTVFENYVERLGREARTGRAAEMLTGG